MVASKETLVYKSTLDSHCLKPCIAYHCNHLLKYIVSCAYRKIIVVPA